MMEFFLNFVLFCYIYKGVRGFDFYKLYGEKGGMNYVLCVNLFGFLLVCRYRFGDDLESKMFISSLTLAWKNKLVWFGVVWV